MSTARIHQIIVGAGTGDAITSMAFHLQATLRSRGPSEIYAYHIEPGVAGRVHPLSDLPPPHRNDLIIYHASYGIPEITRVLLRREQIVVVYHNITPSRFFLDHNPAVASDLEWGRHELSLLLPRTALAVAVSSYNAAELKDIGYSDVHVVPTGLEPSRLLSVAPAGALATDLASRFPRGYVLSVSQVLPHKRHDLLLQSMHLVQWVHELGLGVVVVGADRLPVYWHALHEYARRLRVRDVWFTGQQPDRVLATFFRQANVFVSTSAHEGLALPPLEAMSFGVPVVACEAGAIRDTVAGAGVVLPETSGAALVSEAIAEVHRNEQLRRDLRRRGFERVRALESLDPSAMLSELLDGLA